MCVPPSLITIWPLQGISYQIKVRLNHASRVVHMQCLEGLQGLGEAGDGLLQVGLPISPWQVAVGSAQVVQEISLFSGIPT